MLRVNRIIRLLEPNAAIAYAAACGLRNEIR